jgi:hypothetical protein
MSITKSFTELSRVMGAEAEEAEDAEDAEVLQEQETRWETGALSWAQLPLSWGGNPLLAEPYDECLGQL